MIRCLLLALGIGSALGGVSIQMPYLNPAGVTYSGLHAAVPAVPSHLQYSAATTSSVAYGNSAFFGRSLAPGLSYAAPVAQYAAPVAQYAAPVAHVAAPVAQYAAPVVPTVHHVPAVAQVPVTKYEAQPAVIQNLVDVAKPKLASRKIEIRRPAIQKQFYDVEERVIIRPAGSAVVELDQPVSKSQRGPTVVQPAAHAITTPVVGFRALHSHHHVVPASYPASFSVHQYPIQGPAEIAISSTPSPHHEIEAQPEEAQHNSEQQGAQQIPEQGFQQIPQQVEQQFPQQELQQFPQQDQQQFQQQEQQQFQQQEQQQFQQQEPQQFDDSDSVAVDNPDIARARSQQPQLEQSQGPPQAPQSIPQPQDLLRTLLPQTRSQLFVPQQQLLERFQAMNVEREQDIARTQVRAQEQVVAQLQAQTQAQQTQLRRSEELLQLQQQQLVRSRQAVESVARAQQNQLQQGRAQVQLQAAPSSRSQGEQSAGLPSVGPEPQRGSVRILEASDLRSEFINNLARSTSSPSEIPSFRISPEQSISNQERLISLLTARGGVIESRGQGESSGSNQVRARVLSVTPAPEGASPQEEKVNTRRIVVNRPIQTVEEVNVVEPFTKIERVAVHSPAVIKTARLGVAHLPTSVPVHGYAHALHSAIPAYYK